jgi:hypothetical protein
MELSRDPCVDYRTQPLDTNCKMAHYTGSNQEGQHHTRDCFRLLLHANAFLVLVTLHCHSHPSLVRGAGQKATRLAKEREEQNKRFVEAKAAIKKAGESGLKDMSASHLR